MGEHLADVYAAASKNYVFAWRISRRLRSLDDDVTRAVRRVAYSHKYGKRDAVIDVRRNEARNSVKVAGVPGKLPGETELRIIE